MEGKNVCWISLKSNMTYSKIIHVLGEFCENVLEFDQCKIKLSNLEMVIQIELLVDIFEESKAYIFIDSFDESKDQSSFFIKEIFQKLRKKSFTKIIISTTEKDVLKYISTMDYGMDEYEILIVEIDLNYKIKYILDNLNSKSIVLFYGKMYFLHSVIRDLAYRMIVEDTKIYIHEMFSNIYEKSLFNYNTNKKIQDEYLNLKWGSQKQKSHNTKENKFMAKGRKTTYDEKIEIVAFCIENNFNYRLT